MAGSETSMTLARTKFNLKSMSDSKKYRLSILVKGMLRKVFELIAVKPLLGSNIIQYPVDSFEINESIRLPSIRIFGILRIVSTS
jgi:hypothetical protein